MTIQYTVMKPIWGGGLLKNIPGSWNVEVFVFYDGFYSTYSSQTSPLLKQKPLCPLPFAKGKTGHGCFWKFAFGKEWLLFLNPFRIGAATFLAFYWYRCGHFSGGKLALVKVQPCFLDPFDIGVAAFLEISISNSVFNIWNLMGSILESMTYFWPNFHIWTSIMSYYGLKWKQI